MGLKLGPRASQGIDVGSHFLPRFQDSGSGGFEHFRHRLKEIFQLRFARHVNAEGMAGAAIGLDARRTDWRISEA